MSDMPVLPWVPVNEAPINRVWHNQHRQDEDGRWQRRACACTHRWDHQ